MSPRTAAAALAAYLGVGRTHSVIEQGLTVGQVRRVESELNRLHDRVKETYRKRSEGAAARRRWTEAAQAFREFSHPLFDLWKPEVLRQARTPGAVREAAFVFLEADPWFFRSGYLKERLLRTIKRAQLDPESVERLNAVLLRVVDGRRRREFREYCRVARRFSNQPLRQELESRIETPGSHSRTHASQMLTYVVEGERTRQRTRKAAQQRVEADEARDG